MFINSEQLKNRIKIVVDEISLKSNGKISFEEYISLPYYGSIILRFNLNDSDYTVADLDRYEAIMYECTKDEFLIDFMGEVYRSIGIDYRRMDRLFAGCLDCYGGEELKKSSHATMIEDDAKELLERCGLSSDFPVWEVQIEDEIQLLILGDKNEKVGQFCKDGLTINVCRIESKPCEGLVAAVFYAKRNNISLASALLKVQESLEHD